MSLGSENAGEQARGRKHRRDGEDGAPVALDESGERHVDDDDVGAPSGRPCCPWTMTCSPAFTPLTSSACVGVVSPTVDLALVRLVVVAGDHDEGVVVFVDERFDRHGERVGTLLRATISTRTGVPAASFVPASKAMRTSAADAGRIDRRRPASAPCPSSASVLPGTSTRTRLADLDAPQLGNRHRRDDLQPRRIDDAQDHVRSPTLRPCRRGCDLRLATTPSNRARTIARDSTTAADWLAACACASAARASVSSRLASSSSFCAATPCSTSVVRRVDRGLGVLDARLRLLDFGPSRRRRRSSPTESRSGPADRRCGRGRLRLSAARGCAPARGP